MFSALSRFDIKRQTVETTAETALSALLFNSVLGTVKSSWFVALSALMGP